MSMHAPMFFCFVQSSAFVLDCVTSFGHPLDVCHSLHVYVLSVNVYTYKEKE